MGRISQSSNLILITKKKTGKIYKQASTGKKGKLIQKGVKFRGKSAGSCWQNRWLETKGSGTIDNLVDNEWEWAALYYRAVEWGVETGEQVGGEGRLLGNEKSSENKADTRM